MADQSAEIDDPRPRLMGRKRKAGLRLLGLMLFLPVAVAIILIVSLIDRDITAPSWVREEVEARAEEAIGGGIEMERISIRIGRDLHPRIHLANAELTDRSGTVVARVPEISALISPRGLILNRELLAQEIRVSGAQVSLVRSEDGNLAMSFGDGSASVRESATFTGLLDGIDATFERGPLEALERVELDGLIVNLDDRRAGQSLTVDGGQAVLDIDRREIGLSADLSLLSGGGVSRVAFDYASPRGSREAEMSISVDEASAADIASQSPALSWLSVIDAPISASLRGGIDADGTLGPLNAVLEIGAGAIRPAPEARPVPFDAVKAYLAYDPETQELAFDQLSLESEDIAVEANGEAFLKGMEDGFPDEIWGQFRMPTLTANPNDIYDVPVELAVGSLDFRLALDPFRLTLGELIATEGDSNIRAWGEVSTGEDGWNVAVDARIDRVTVPHAKALWPEVWRPGVRGWVANNILDGDIVNAAVAVRTHGTEEPVIAMDFEFEDGSVRYLPRMPAVEGGYGFVQIGKDSFSVSLAEGYVAALEGGRVDMAGSTFVIPAMSLPDSPAEFSLKLDGTITAMLSVLDQPPLSLMQGAGLDVTLADGRARAQGRLLMPLSDQLSPDQVSYVFGAELTDVRSTTLVPDKVLASPQLEVAATPEGLRIEGPARLGQTPLTGSFSRAFEEGAPARIEAQVELSPAALDEFGIALPPGTVQGSGPARFDLVMPAGLPPSFILSSEMRGITLSVPWVGWSKAAGTPGTLEVQGQLGASPKVSRLRLQASGLTAEGRIDLGANSAFEAAVFDRLSVGDWLDAPITLRNRGAGQAVGVEVNGGTLDMRRAAFGPGGGDGGEGGPMNVRLDRLVVTESLVLTGFEGAFASQGGLRGTFEAQVNEGPPIAGDLVPVNGRTGVRVTSNDAGGVLRAAKLLPNALGGAMQLILRPTGGEGTYDGSLTVDDLRIRDAPAIAELLDAISVVGLLQQLDGQGLSFTDVDAQFRMTPEQIIVTQSSAVGPSLGLSLDGTYTLASTIMDFQGVVSPVYLLNGIGSVLTRPGEGLIGFNFTIRGPVGQPNVGVNPLSVLTPGMFREIFRRPPPQVTR
ncbi:DUF3971 domain-containing protein [Pelagovum pacificum]|uniref:DUF3971 domain-containing protein n=1 Tax=Pelagovum pacificum TaxID=2588711 RepID=A0A5C5GCT9_9RHOB|nr:DUF3971 domain-containing protein [Pelagovum pacificum]QQA41398.1 DUF3971 domain-containing protein [Pelagovum pacificum]TNY31799.1 DUF3971 domain-containing protein [Pelagovum pacificum]